MASRRSSEEAKVFQDYYHNRRDKELPQDSRYRALVQTCVRDGYVVIPNAFTEAEADEAKAEIDRLHGESPLIGRTEFEGYKTNRMWALLGKSRAFDKFCLIPEVHALNEYFLSEDYLIYIMTSIVIQPGQKAQFLHHDDAGTRMPRPRPPMSVGTMICLEDFTETNGATRIVPGSHQWGDGVIAQDEQAVPALAKKGSVIYFLGTTWHSGGANVSSHPRYAITIQYCQPWIRPFEDLKSAIDPRRILAGEIDDRIVGMMGYRAAEPFWGVVDGLNPIKGAKRLVRWLQNPVETTQPGYAKEEGETEPWFKEKKRVHTSKL